jgi:HAD superfamily hydrolase (TIGR01549 family)
MPNAWLNDIYLKSIADDLERFDIISSDVFDTLIFRTCRTPSDIFGRVGEKIAVSRFDWRYSPVAYSRLRITAEQRAREKKGRGVDCTFEEIFREFPFSDEIKQELAQLEIKCEKDAQFLNQSVLSLLTDALGRGKKIVVVSNMYYNAAQILEFLRSAGVDVGLISKVYVSSEHGCRKDSGELFKRMLNDNPDVPRGRVLHVGDNEKADIIGAKNAGIRAVHYAATNNKFGSLHDFEQLKYGVQSGELYAVRRLSTASNPYDGENSKFFHDFGAEVIGPLYALFAEWIVRYAEKRGVNVILAFMREGELLSKVINRTAEVKDSNVTGVPTYISRHPAFMASIFEENFEERLSVLFRRNELSVRQLFGFFNTDAAATPFAGKSETAINKLPLNERKGLLEYLGSNAIRDRILRCSEHNRNLLFRYVRSVTDGKPALTADIGFKGTTQFFLNDIFMYGKWEQELCHALMMGVSQTSILNIFNGADIITWLGFLGENEKEIDIIYRNPLLLESLVNSTCGSTYGYAEDNGDVAPLLEDAVFDNAQKECVKAVRAGVENFLEHFLSVTKINPNMTERLLEKKKDFLNILCRFMQSPTADEARIIGGFSYDDTFLNVGFRTFAGEMPPIGLSESEIPEFMSRARRAGSYWPEAAVTRVYPQYGLKRAIGDLDNTLYSDIFAICERIKSAGMQIGYVFCASEACVKFCEFAKLFGIELKGIADSDKRLHGSVVGGLKVVDINDIRKTPDYFFVASYVYAKEVSKIITDKYSGQARLPRIFLLGEQ